MGLYRRVVLKITGGAFEKETVGFSYLDRLVHEIANAKQMVQLAIVLGGGNFARGGKINRQEQTAEQSIGDCYGMVGTTLNALLLHNGLKVGNVRSRIMGAWSFGSVIPIYSASDAITFLEHEQVVILAGGLGRGGISTDTAAVVRALELRADIVLKGTKVDGIYTANPKLDSKAKLIPRLTHQRFEKEQFVQILDPSAVQQAGARKLPIHVFNIFHPGALRDVLTGQLVGSLITSAV